MRDWFDDLNPYDDEEEIEETENPYEEEKPNYIKCRVWRDEK